MSDRMTDLTDLRRRILRFCLEDGAKQTGDILAVPEIRAYPQRLVRRMTHALALSGLLETWGNTSGAWYLTSHLGYVALASLRETETLTAKCRRNPADDVN